MSAITSADVTYAQVPRSAHSSPSDPRHEAMYTVEFGGGSAEYPNGGIPLLKAKLGCPTQIDSLLIEDMDSDEGYLIKYDKSAQTLRLYQTAAVSDTDPAAPLVELADEAAVGAASLTIKVKGW